jgi:uncharacterized protein YcsI (UPF0317 family)
MTDFDRLRRLPVGDLRALIRRNDYIGHTAGLAAGRLQVNLAILPEAYALDFFRFCQRNPRPCPLVGVSDAGSRALHTLGADLQADTDAPAYAVYRDGAFETYQSDVSDLWQDDFVAFALGCSFSFEHAAMAAGVSMRHVDCNRTVPMFRTTIPTVPAGPLSGGMVVSMRPVRPDQLSLVTEISAEFPLAHGAPVHIGDPAAIGISDLQKPDYGEAVPIESGEVPVFWACGVTPQNAALRADLPIFISHRPGAMLITDVDERANPPILT